MNLSNIKHKTKETKEGIIQNLAAVNNIEQSASLAPNI